VFHAAWERRALGLNLCSRALGSWNIDEGRHAQETLHPVDYLSSSYYERWMKGLEKLLVRYDYVTGQELAAGHRLHEGTRPKHILAADAVAAVLSRGSRYDRPIAAPPKFALGQAVRTINEHWLEDYNNIRPHDALRGLPPHQFALQKA